MGECRCAHDGSAARTRGVRVAAFTCSSWQADKAFITASNGTMRNHFFKLILPVVSLAAAARAFAPMADPQLVLGGTGNNGFDSQDFVVNEGKPSISDLMTVDGSLSIFYGYLRESTGLVRMRTALLYHGWK